MLVTLREKTNQKEDVDERPVATRSGRAINRRAEIDFSLISFKLKLDCQKNSFMYILQTFPLEQVLFKNAL